MIHSKYYARKHLKKLFLLRLGYELNLQNPKTFNEKLNWIKLYGITPLMWICADKYRVLEYLEKKGFGKYVVPLYAVADSFDDLDWEILPKRFVLKTNHDSSGAWIVKNKANADKKILNEEISACLNRIYGIDTGEYHYAKIPSKVIAQELLGKPNKLLEDYKFFCFNGKCNEMFITIKSEPENPEYYFFDRNWKMLKYIYSNPIESDLLTLPKPKKLSEMFDLAEQLSQPFAFVRVDLYYENHNIHFGELTFFPEAGFDQISYKADKLFGKRLII